MDKLWKWVMHLNAKAFCLAAILFFFGVSLLCGWQITHPVEPLKDGAHGKLPELAQGWSIGTLDFVSNQLTAETLSIPVDPFRPTLESILTNETERAAFLKALKNAQNAAAGITDKEAKEKKNPFAHLRKKAPVPGSLVGPNGQPMIHPALTFKGYFQRPDGKQAALFSDSANGSTVFYDAGKQVHGVDILDANVREAKIRLPDGSVTTLPIGKDVELAAEPAPVKPAPPAAAKPAAATAKTAAVKPTKAATAGAAKAAAQKKTAPKKAAPATPREP